MALVYLASFAVIAAAISAELLLAARDGRFLFLITGLAVAGIAWVAGFGPALLAIALSAAAVNYFVLQPGAWFDLGGPLETAAFTGFIAGWAAIAWIARGARERWLQDAAARTHAERAAAHTARLAALSAALGRARSEPAVLEAAVQESLHALRADAAMVLLMAEPSPSARVHRAVAYEGIPDPTGRDVPVGDDALLADAVRRRVPVLVESRAPEGPGGVIPPAYRASAAVPILVAGQLTGIVRLDFLEPRTFTDDDREFLDVLARFAGHTLDRARQYEAAQRARDEAEGLRHRADQELAHRQQTEQALRSSETRYRALATRTTRLHGLTAALSEAVTVEAVAAAVVQQGNVVVGATSASVWTLADDGASLDLLYGEAYGRPVRDAARLLLEPGRCETEGVRQRAPLYVASWEDAQEHYWQSASAAADAAYVSSAVLPLLVEGTPIGVLRFDFSVPVNFDSEYQALLVSVAQHCTQAIDRARLYEAAQKARADAEAANRHKDEFLSIVSHELRTPLNAVLGWAVMLQKGTADPGLAARALQSIHDNATRQAKLIDDLLDLSRIVAGRATLDLQEVDIAELIAGVAESFVPIAASSEVQLSVAPLPHAIIEADARRLEQVFFNLLANGLKFTGAGGRIDIDASVAGSTVEIRVRDNGIGIEPEFLPYVFERFRQANSTATRQYGGLGLGLSIAKQLVTAHKGQIRVESEGRGKGAVFVVSLPARGVTAAPRSGHGRTPPPARMTPPPRLDGIRVLGVDDEPAAREILAYALSEQGAHVTVASSAAEAFARLTTHHFDVLLADIAMPDEDGCALIRRIRAMGDPQLASIPAAAVTAHAREEERRAVLEAGFQLHLVKPIEPADLARAVNELARQRREPGYVPCLT